MEHTHCLFTGLVLKFSDNYSKAVLDTIWVILKIAWDLNSNVFMSTLSGECHSFGTNIKDFLVREGGRRGFNFNIYVSVYGIWKTLFKFLPQKVKKPETQYITVLPLIHLTNIYKVSRINKGAAAAQLIHWMQNDCKEDRRWKGADSRMDFSILIYYLIKCKH